MPWSLSSSQAGLADPENAGFVAIERKRLSVSMNVLARDLKIPERGLGTAEEHNHHHTSHNVYYVK